jgi:hypothetical protein
MVELRLGTEAGGLRVLLCLGQALGKKERWIGLWIGKRKRKKG